MKEPPREQCKPLIKLTDGEWYAHAPNRSRMANALLVGAINFVRVQNERRRAQQRKAKRRATQTEEPR
jgi:hypothetical protein